MSVLSVMTIIFTLVICISSALSNYDYSPQHGVQLEVQHHRQEQHLSVRVDDEETDTLLKDIYIFASSMFANQTPVEVNSTTNPTIQGGEATDPQTKARRNVVRKMMKHAWDGYAAHAWGKNEVRPVSKSGNLGTVFGSSDCGATIVDSMDTLYIMGLEKEFARGREWISTSLNLTKMSGHISVFETNIRYVGGLLTAFAFTGDEMFKTKAVEIVEKLLPAFATPTGIPHGRVNMQTGLVMKEARSILSEFGTLHMEFSYLSDITGNIIYKDTVETIRNFLDKKVKHNNLYPNFLNPTTGQWGENHCSVGALGDSFYEYLIKEWLRTGKTDEQAKKMFDEAASGIEQMLLQTSSQGQTYLAEWKGSQLEHKMDHLACFAGGMFGLAAASVLEDTNRTKLMKMAEGITETCHRSYENTVTKLGPEVMRFDGTSRTFDRSYLLRPETVESYFVLWRLTKNPKYREWGWKVVQALEKNCKVEGGYSGVVDVNYERSSDDVQQSFFLSETLKYLYLLFSEDDLIDLDQWVFNTEAHPLPIKGVNTFYRAYNTLDSSRVLHDEL
eukprot:GFUD01024661.1.p1 GENE.GFUD01024661.1~~GFUD01024661.1.p1  ORF type:complete len:559 (+),score=150.76 GFUD01024661.1:124-1800(+)